MIQELGVNFLLGLATPLTALCVIPLYPSFISYLSDQVGESSDTRLHLMFGGIVVAGLLTFMLLLGLVFTTLLKQSLTGVIQIVSPAAFGLLALMGVFMLLDMDVADSIPRVEAPEFENPLLNGYGFGFFFGAIVIPCNPALIALFFSRSLLLQDPVNSILNFTSFGLGMGAPLIAFSVLSAQWNDKIMGFLTGNRETINRGTGALVLIISLYYLFLVFRVQTWI
jgi:cytochrome c-type biogenesis protein